MTQEKNLLCPNCNSRLFFSGNGRSLLCDRCGFEKLLEQPKPDLQALLHAYELRKQYKHLNQTEGQSAASIRLAEGREALRNGRPADAYDALSAVLKSQSTEAERADAWYWLSHLFESPDEKRRCLQEALTLFPGLSAAHRDLAIIDGRLNLNDVIDPSQLSHKRTATEETAVAQKYTCPQCDAGMRFSAEQQRYGCPFCGYLEAIDPSATVKSEQKVGRGDFEQAFIVALSTAKGHLEPINLRTLQCNSCTTEFLLNPKTLSITCPYCESVFVTETAVSKELMPPHALIPFGIPLEQAEVTLHNWLKQRQYAPENVAPLHGVYLPLWTFDVGGSIRWHGIIQKDERQQKVSGTRIIFYDDVLVPGCRHTSKTLIKNYKKFDLTQLEAYDARYLAQWPAERYTFPLANASLWARKQILKQLRSKPQKLTKRSEYVQQLRIDTQKMMVESYKLLLLPVWVGHYRLNGTEYEATINGQTGEVVAERPSTLLSTVKGWLGGRGEQ